MNVKAAIKTSVLLSLLFLVIYGGTNWLTAWFRHDVPSCQFGWERFIPFIPLMIVPYMSIDLFFVAAPFVCDDREREILARRLVAAVLIAGACFLIFPLRFAFDRPPVAGVLGLVFNHFRTLDQPFNELPSLHIAIQIILMPVYLRHTRGFLRWIICAWFTLIALSTLLTWQHHVIDVIGGVVLGVLCIHLFQDQPLAKSWVRNDRIGLYYLLAAFTLTCVAILFHPFALILLWPAMSLGLMAAGYFRFGAGVFRKSNGRLPISTMIVLGPVLLGQHLSLAWYARQSRPWDELCKGLWIGRKLSDAEAQQAIDQGVTAVLDLTAEFTESGPFRSIAYRSIPVLDLTAPTAAQLDDAIDFIRAQIELGGTVYVHCKAGYSRSAAVAGAYLLSSREAQSVEEAMAILRRARPGIVIRSEALHALKNASPGSAAVPSPIERRRSAHPTQHENYAPPDTPAEAASAPPLP